MKINIRRRFTYQVDSRTTEIICPGVYDVPGQITKELADKIIKWGRAHWVAEKKAPENKVAKVAENKTRLGKKAKSGDSTGAKP